MLFLNMRNGSRCLTLNRERWRSVVNLALRDQVVCVQRNPAR